MKHFLSCLTILLLIAEGAIAQMQEKDIEIQIADFVKDKKATVGVAVLTEDDKIIQYNNSVHFPLLSVFKFHVALAVLNKLDKQHIDLDSTIQIKASQLRAGTYSPLRDKFPNQDLTLSWKELLQYSISLSDNNACDILIDSTGGIAAINKYIQKLGIKDFNLSATEDFMHQGIKNAYLNWSTPLEVVRLMKLAYTKELFSAPYKDFLWKTMLETSTGANKLKGLLPENVLVGHKTGSSDRTKEGIKIADNDAGLVLLPQGKSFYIAVFIMDSQETDQTNAAIIAHISKLVYEAMIP
ncbi:class A beta-lactamase, subclass A2 [Odoribacter laneus]|uniref:class A beta-lactamase, subclass A2 n=1 Tax=Odoribacter laneus TaxID=626933 RepID=UPI0018978061|nr:class A beta-lactamase, subclass A2 [Odoribacter laneus]